MTTYFDDITHEGLELSSIDHKRRMEELKQEHNKVLSEYYKDCEDFYKQIQQLTEERDQYKAVLASLSLFVSAGIGDDSTTAEEYASRIKDGITQMIVDFSKRT